ncbi:protein BPS1, chloroplastic-like [Cryptomeria japonica]|uniref:protein BPS1, chloroplastic-like n=1 Tax=Cryptomeria japonica TaxID=3369 RepID=UPI0027DA787A|nr:protein BPS1, chloroplastic-like [Cryptomeria japonica]
MALHFPHKNRHNRSKSMPSRLQGDPILTDALISEVERLEDCCSSSSCFGGDWLAQALEVAMKCCSNLSDMKIHMESKWMNAHLDDILHLLEACNVLRDTIADIRKQNACIQIAIRGLGPALTPSVHVLQRAHTSIASWLKKKNDTNSQLEKCMSNLRRMAEKLNREDRAGVEGAVMNMIHAKAIIIMVCSAFVAALSFKTSHMRMPSLPLPTHFSRLHDKLREAVEMRKRSSSSRLLNELEGADIALGNLNNHLNSNSKLHLPLHLSPATVALHQLETTLPQFEHKINQLFRFLISTRVALLNSLSSH